MSNAGESNYPSFKVYICTDTSNIMSETTKFFFYEITALLHKKPIELKKILEGKNFVNVTNGIVLDSTEQKVVYDYFLRQMDDDFYFGKIMRTRPPDRFFVKKSHNILEKLTEWLKRGEKHGIGETEKDVSYFVLKLQKNSIIVLMQTGYMIAGIGKLKELLLKILSSECTEISSKALEVQKVRNMLKFLRDKKIRTLRLRFRKNPEVPSNSIVENTIKSIHSVVSEDFYVEIIVTAGKLGKKTRDIMPQFGDVFRRLFGKEINLNDIDIDFPEFLSNFEVEYIAPNGEIVGSENILDNYEKVQINVAVLTLQNDDQIANILLQKFKEKLAIN